MNEAIAELDEVLTEAVEGEAAARRRRDWRPLLFLIVFSPVLALGIAVGKYAVDIPHWDDWERGEMWRRYHAGTLDFEYMYSPHIEHRNLFPRLLTLAYGVWFTGDIRLEIWTIYGLVVGTCLLCFRLLRETLRGSVALWPAAFLINLLLCCPMQYPDFLWASMVAFMLPFFCLAAILVTAISRLPVWLKFVFTIVLAELGTHSFSQGLVLWPVALCLPLFSVRGFGSWRSRVAYAAAVAVVAVLTLVPYFTWHFETHSHPSHTYSLPTGERPSSIERLARVFDEPREVQEYFFKALGDPLVRAFSRNPPEMARDVGRVLFAIFLAATGFMLWRRRDSDTWQRLLPWAAAGWFAVTVALMLALGRSANATDRSTMPRYIPMTMFMVVAIVAIASYFFIWWSRRAADCRQSARRARWGWAAWAAASVVLANLWSYGFFKMNAWHNARLEAHAALIYIELFEPEEVGRFDNTVGFARSQARIMNRHGLLHPPLVKEWGFGPFVPRAHRLGLPGAETRGVVSSGGWLDLSGYALLPGGRVADGVLISLRRPGEAEWQIAGFAEMRSAHLPANLYLYDSHFGQGHDYSPAFRYARFAGKAELPDDDSHGVLEVLCWALDADSWSAYPIGEAIEVNVNRAG